MGNVYGLREIVVIFLPINDDHYFLLLPFLLVLVTKFIITHDAIVLGCIGNCIGRQSQELPTPSAFVFGWRTGSERSRSLQGAAKLGKQPTFWTFFDVFEVFLYFIRADGNYRIVRAD